MKYNYNYLLEHQDKVLKTMPNNNSLPVIEYQIKNNFVNNHNRITYDFINSKGWKEYERFDHFYNKRCGYLESYDVKKALWLIPQDSIQLLDKKLYKIPVNEWTFDLLKPYMKYLAWHFSIDMMEKDKYPYRWGYIRSILYYDATDEEKWNDVFSFIQSFYDNIDKPNYKFEPDQKSRWNKILGCCWSCIEMGLPEVALWIVDILFKMFGPIEEELNCKLRDVFTVQVDHRMRILGTLSYIKAFAHKGLGQNEEYYNTLKYYVDYFEQGNKAHYLINNRVLEASILVYSYNPTADNKKIAESISHYNCGKYLDEPTECMRERGLIMFDYIKTFYKKEYEEYNSRT
jgi:hypothetical protein